MSCSFALTSRVARMRTSGDTLNVVMLASPACPALRSLARFCSERFADAFDTAPQTGTEEHRWHLILSEGHARCAVAPLLLLSCSAACFAERRVLRPSARGRRGSARP